MRSKCITGVLVLAASCVAGWAQTLINLQSQTRNADFSNFPFTRPVSVGTKLPSTCQIGQLFYNSAAPAGANLYSCTAANSWTLQGGAGVSSVGWGTLPNWLTGSVANSLTTPSLSLSPTVGQASHQVLGTGTGSSFAPISLSAADLPATISSNTSGTAANVSGTIAVANGGTGQTTASTAFNALSPMTTLGDLLYGGASGAASRLAGNKATTKNFLTQTGTGTNSAIPVWGTIAASDLPGTIASNTSGNAGTATALATTPQSCSSGQYATGVAASGNAICAQVAYSQLNGTPSLYNQIVQVNGVSQAQAGTLNLLAGSNVSLTGATSGGITTVTVNSTGQSGGISGPGSSTNYALPYWNGTSGNALGNSGITTDASADLNAAGTITAASLSSSGSGAGTISLSQGSSQGSFGANSFSMYAPSSIPTSYQWVAPSADAAGAIFSDGNGTPGHLSINPTAHEIYKVTTTSSPGAGLSAIPLATPSTNTLYRVTLYWAQTSIGTGCTSATPATIQPWLQYTEAATGNAVVAAIYSYYHGNAGTTSTPASMSASSAPIPLAIATSSMPYASSSAMTINAAASLPFSYGVNFTNGSGCTVQPSYSITAIIEAY